MTPFKFTVYNGRFVEQHKALLVAYEKGELRPSSPSISLWLTMADMYFNSIYFNATTWYHMYWRRAYKTGYMPPQNAPAILREAFAQAQQEVRIFQRCKTICWSEEKQAEMKRRYHLPSGTVERWMDEAVLFAYQEHLAPSCSCISEVGLNSREAPTRCP